MIRLSRQGMPLPLVYASKALAIERNRAAEFYAISRKKRMQRRFDWTPTTSLLRGVRDQLAKLSFGKCAYCERLLPGPSALQHFRPKRGAIGSDGKAFVDHYWWLVFEWTNLIPCCSECHVIKASRFPVKRRRAGVGTVGESLLKEEPQLLDPFQDEPGTHLAFTETGHVVNRTERGEATIDILALNRQTLMQSRSKHIEELRTAMAKAGLSKDQQRRVDIKVAVVTLTPFLQSTSPHLAVTLQYLSAWGQEFPSNNILTNILKAASGPLIHLVGSLVRKRAPSKAELDVAQNQFEERTRRKVQHSIESEDKAAKSAYFAGARRLERIVIHNFKAIHHLEIEFPSPTSDRESWLTLVGENAVGKSSLLQGIALALMGQQQIARMGLDASQLVCREGDGDEGWIRAHLTNLSQPIELRFSRHDRSFLVTPAEPLVLLLGYGATRLLPRTVTRRERLGRYIRVRNIFNPYARLSPTERFLTDRKRVDDSRFAQAGWALKQLLLLGDGDTVVRERRRVFIQTDGFRASLMDLSDGYQSIVALAGDIMAGVLNKWESIEYAEGIVLIDEIEAHLHPFWKMQIVTRLRRVFPKLMFIMTTHDPLCLRGLLPGEIVVMRRAKREIIAEPVRESIDHLRADQLLTSPLFGLAHTRADSIEREIERCSELLGKSARTAAEDAELIELQERLSMALQVSETPRQRIVERETQAFLADRNPEQVWGPLPKASAVSVTTDLNESIGERLTSIKSLLA